jgi:hypothetical protein
MFQPCIFQRFVETTSGPFSACFVFTLPCSRFESSDNDFLPNTRLENALTGEQMRLRIYTYPRRQYNCGGVVMVAHRSPLLISAADCPDAASSNREEEDWFQNDEKPIVKNFLE